MNSFEIARTLHVLAVYCSLAGFLLRGYWMLSDSALFRARATRVIPHCIDTLLLGSAISMLVILQVSPLHLPWLVAKLIALLVYIGLGMVAFRFGPTRRSRSLAWLASIAVFVYMLGVAQAKSPASWWVLPAG